MYKIHYIVFSLITLLAVSCRQGEVEYVDFDTFHPMSIVESNVIGEDGCLNPLIKVPELAEDDTIHTVKRIASTSMNDMARDILGSIHCNSVIQIAGTFVGHDLDGSPLLQSGKLLLPKTGSIKRVLWVSHYTIGANHEAPSETFPFEGILAAKGYAVVMADYIGYGITCKRIHPYLHAESTAQSVVDMGMAVMPYLEYIGRKPEHDEVILMGYSQGGAVTMAVMRMLEQDNSYGLPVAHVYAGAGPYDMAKTFDYSVQMDKTGIPCAVPMIVQGMNIGENLRLSMEKFFVPGMWDLCREAVNSKRYTVQQINRKIGVNEVSKILSAYGRDKRNSETERLYRAMSLNSVLDFKPHAPLFMFHSMDDGTVPFVNSQAAEKTFKGCNVQYDFGHYGAHVNGFLRFLGTVSDKLDELDK